MARKAAVLRPPSSYDLVARRIQRQLLSPRVQLERTAVISRQDGESPDDWSALLEQLGEEPEVTMSRCEDGSVLLSWSAPRPE